MASSAPESQSPTVARRARWPAGAGGVAAQGTGFSVTDLVDRFQRMLQAQERSPCTVKQYGHIARTFLAYTQKPLEAVTMQDLEAFREYLVLHRRYSKNSLYTTIRGLACLFRSFGLETADGLQPPRRPERLPRYLTEEEMHRLFDAVKESPRDSAIVHVLAFGGLRVGELCHLKVEDLEFERNVLHVRFGEGRQGSRSGARGTFARRDRPLPRRPHGLGNVLPPAVPRRTGDGRADRATLGPGGRDPRRVTPHVLRHTLATALLSRGCDIRYIQKLLGHASVATTQIYTHVDTQALREAYQRAKPQY